MRVVIVGGGVVGTMHALMARRRGHEVVQLERDAGPRRASVRNFGLVWVSGRAAGAELELALRARTLWEELGAEVPGVGYRPGGSLTVALTAEELAVMEEASAALDAAARGMKLLDAAEVRGVNPAVRGEVAGALWCERDAVVEPGQVLGAVRAHLGASDGYRFAPGRAAVDIGPGKVGDHTGEVHRGDLVILCTGDAHERLAGAPLRRCRLQMMQTEPFPERLTTSVADGDSLRYYPAFAPLPALESLPAPPDVVGRWRLQLLLVQRAGGGLTIGDTHAYDEPFDFAVEEEPYAHLTARAEAVLGQRLPPVVRRWAGVYSQSTDDRVAFRAELHDGVHVVTGLGGRGMTLSPAVAEETGEALGL